MNILLLTEQIKYVNMPKMVPRWKEMHVCFLTTAPYQKLDQQFSLASLCLSWEYPQKLWHALVDAVPFLSDSRMCCRSEDSRKLSLFHQLAYQCLKTVHPKKWFNNKEFYFSWKMIRASKRESCGLEIFKLISSPISKVLEYSVLLFLIYFTGHWRDFQIQTSIYTSYLIQHGHFKDFVHNMTQSPIRYDLSSFFYFLLMVEI